MCLNLHFNSHRFCSKSVFGILISFQILSCLLIVRFRGENPLQLYPDYTTNNLTELKLLQNITHNRNFTNKDKFTLQDDKNIYFTHITADLTCYTEGTNLKLTEKNILGNHGSKNVTHRCRCISGYHGRDCGIPDAIWNSRYHKTEFSRLLKRRSVPRRVINGIPLLREFDILEARMNELGGAVDLFMLAESNFSAHGDHKELYIRDQLNVGFLKDYHYKIIHVYVDFFPELAKTNSWVADEYLRVYLGKTGIPRISGIRDDDLFIINDADEIPSRSVVMFLKLYDGYTEPVGLVLRWSVYGFFWKNKEPNLFSSLLRINKEKTTTVYAVATMGLVRDVMDNDPFMIRKHLQLTKVMYEPLLAKYNQKHPGQFDPWEAGQRKHYAGWHCSWCFGPEDIVLKLDSAQAGDKPRWGDYPEKHERKYLLGLIRDGRWFDDTTTMFLSDPNERYYAPPYVLAHRDRFSSILYHPRQFKMFSTRRPRLTTSSSTTRSSHTTASSSNSIIRSSPTTASSSNSIVRSSNITASSSNSIRMR